MGVAWIGDLWTRVSWTVTTRESSRTVGLLCSPSSSSLQFKIGGCLCHHRSTSTSSQQNPQPKHVPPWSEWEMESDSSRILALVSSVALSTRIDALNGGHGEMDTYCGLVDGHLMDGK